MKSAETATNVSMHKGTMHMPVQVPASYACTLIHTHTSTHVNTSTNTRIAGKKNEIMAFAGKRF